MKDPLLDYYERELGFIRDEGREFARRYPKIAGRLRLSDAENIEDPHVSRLIEAFALLCARLRLKVQDEFPEVCHSLLQSLYPQYLAPIPPIAICQLKLTELAMDLPQGRLHRRGERLESEPVDGTQASFRLCYDTQVLPISIDAVEYLEHPLPFEVEPTWKNQVEATIRIRLSSKSEKLPLELIQFECLRFFLAGTTALGTELYEAVFGDLVGITLYNPKRAFYRSLPTTAARHVGFDRDQTLLDNDPRNISSYQLLWEFFAAPEKFRFVDFKLDDVWQNAVRGADYVDLVLLLKKANPVVKRELRPDSIRLGCSPIINLFEQRAEPFRLTGNKTEYRIQPSSRKPMGMEVVSIQSVTATSPGGSESKVFKPFFLPSHHSQSVNDEALYWHSSRRRRLAKDAEGDRGTEVFLTLVDLHAEPLSIPDWTLHVSTVCCNRDLVARLPYGGGRPKMTLREAGGAVAVELVTTPTPTRRPINSDDYYWRLISHLSLNHLSLSENETGATALREILMLYNPSDSEETKRAIQSIESINYSRTIGRTASGHGTGFCRGIGINLMVDEERLVGMGPFLFATVLDYFFSLFATINSFTKLEVRTLGRTEPLYQGRPRTGTKCLL